MKSIRNIYITLSKLFHPDTETDPVLKIQKEEIMKRVTTAYKQKDLTTLLKLEMEWGYKEKEHLEKLTEDKFEIYISVLKEQIAEFEVQKYNLYMHPKTDEISEFVTYPENIARILISQKAGKIKKENEDLLSNIAKLEKSNPKKQITDFVTEFLEKQNYFSRNILNAIMNMPIPGKQKNPYKYR